MITPAPLHVHLHCPQAEFFHRAVTITKAQKAAVEAKGLKKVAEFRASLKDTDEGTWPAELKTLKADVGAFAASFPVVGFDASKMRYKL